VDSIVSAKLDKFKSTKLVNFVQLRGQICPVALRRDKALRPIPLESIYGVGFAGVGFDGRFSFSLGQAPAARVSPKGKLAGRLW
jgi:hypothetical protein